MVHEVDRNKKNKKKYRQYDDSVDAAFAHTECDVPCPGLYFHVHERAPVCLVHLTE